MAEQRRRSRLEMGRQRIKTVVDLGKCLFKLVNDCIQNKCDDDFYDDDDDDCAVAISINLKEESTDDIILRNFVSSAENPGQAQIDILNILSSIISSVKVGGARNTATRDRDYNSTVKLDAAETSALFSMQFQINEIFNLTSVVARQGGVQAMDERMIIYTTTGDNYTLRLAKGTGPYERRVEEVTALQRRPVSTPGAGTISFDGLRSSENSNLLEFLRRDAEEGTNIKCVHHEDAELYCSPNYGMASQVLMAAFNIVYKVSETLEDLGISSGPSSTMISRLFESSLLTQEDLEEEVDNILHHIFAGHVFGQQTHFVDSEIYNILLEVIPWRQLPAMLLQAQYNRQLLYFIFALLSAWLLVLLSLRYRRLLPLKYRRQHRHFNLMHLIFIFLLPWVILAIAAVLSVAAAANLSHYKLHENKQDGITYGEDTVQNTAHHESVNMSLQCSGKNDLNFPWSVPQDLPPSYYRQILIMRWPVTLLETRNTSYDINVEDLVSKVNKSAQLRYDFQS